MKKNTVFILILTSILFVVIGCNTNNNNQEETSPSNETTNEANINNNKNESDDSSDKNAGNDHSTNEEHELTMRELSDEIIEALDNKDMQTVTQYVHPEKGLLFSPYVYVEEDAVVFEKSEVASILDSEEIYDWGNYDGKGTSIKLTPSEYFDEFIETKPFLVPDDVIENDPQDRGNTINNIEETFPRGQMIEFYDEGSEEYAGIDWLSINLIYEEDGLGALKLVAIVGDMWTI